MWIWTPTETLALLRTVYGEDRAVTRALSQKVSGMLWGVKARMERCVTYDGNYFAQDNM
jgi:hypothetical protein